MEENQDRGIFKIGGKDKGVFQDGRGEYRYQVKKCLLDLTTWSSWVNLVRAFAIDLREEKSDWAGL